MELRDYIEMGVKRAGSLTALGKFLDLSQPTMSETKAQRRSLPLDKCVMLADYIGADLRAVIAANELVTEKKEEKRRFWTPFVLAERLVPHLTIAVVAISANVIFMKALELASLNT